MSELFNYMDTVPLAFYIAIAVSILILTIDF